MFRHRFSKKGGLLHCLQSHLRAPSALWYSTRMPLALLTAHFCWFKTGCFQTAWLVRCCTVFLAWESHGRVPLCFGDFHIWICILETMAHSHDDQHYQSAIASKCSWAQQRDKLCFGQNSQVLRSSGARFTAWEWPAPSESIPKACWI